MAEREERRRTIRQDDLAHECLEIGVVFGKAADMTFVGIRYGAFREALPAPVDHRDRKAASPRLGNHLEILFDELRPAGQEDQRSLAALRGSPASKPQSHAIRGF